LASNSAAVRVGTPLCSIGNVLKAIADALDRNQLSKK
jgi:hypothetical protein